MHSSCATIRGLGAPQQEDGVQVDAHLDGEEAGERHAAAGQSERVQGGDDGEAERAAGLQGVGLPRGERRVRGAGHGGQRGHLGRHGLQNHRDDHHQHRAENGHREHGVGPELQHAT